LSSAESPRQIDLTRHEPDVGDVAGGAGFECRAIPQRHPFNNALYGFRASSSKARLYVGAPPL